MKDQAPPLRTPRLRRLSDDEIELWTQIAASVTPRPGARLPQRLTLPPPPPTSPGRAAPPAAAVAQLPKQPAPQPFAPLDRALRRKLSRGRMTADAAIDLHGLRQDEAYGALRHFLLDSQREGARVVLVVTGKGSRGGDPLSIIGAPGVLRRSVPLWLALPDFRPLVIGFEEASRPHGGAGALYIRLRRRS